MKTVIFFAALFMIAVVIYIETGQFNPTAKLALVWCIALDKKFEELFYFEE